MQVQRIQSNPQPQQSFGMLKNPIDPRALEVINFRIECLVNTRKSEDAEYLAKTFPTVREMIKACQDVHLDIRYFLGKESAEEAIPVVGPYNSGCHSESYANMFVAKVSDSCKRILEITTQKWEEAPKQLVEDEITGRELPETVIKVTMPSDEAAVKACQEINSAKNEFYKGAIVSKILDEDVARQRAADDAQKTKIAELQAIVLNAFV